MLHKALPVDPYLLWLGVVLRPMTAMSATDTLSAVLMQLLQPAGGVCRMQDFPAGPCSMMHALGNSAVCWLYPFGVLVLQDACSVDWCQLHAAMSWP